MDGKALLPEDDRKFDINDGVFVPGLFPLDRQMDRKAPNNSLEITNKTGFIEILDNGKFQIKNEGAELFTELVNILEELIKGFDNLGMIHKTNTIFGPQKPINFATYNQIKSALDGLKLKIEELKGGP